jgi:hypothetical protein
LDQLSSNLSSDRVRDHEDLLSEVLNRPLTCVFLVGLTEDLKMRPLGSDSAVGRTLLGDAKTCADLQKPRHEIVLMLLSFAPFGSVLLGFTTS